MDIQKIRNQNENNVCIKIDEGQAFAHECSMLTFNSILGLLPVSIRCVDEFLFVEYRPSGMLSFSELFKEKRFDDTQLTRLVYQLCEVQETLREYMLSGDGLVLDPDYIYMDIADHALKFCYLPGMRQSVDENARPLLHFLLDHVDYTNQRAVAIAYGLFSQKDGAGNAIAAFKRYVDSVPESGTRYDMTLPDEYSELECAESGPEADRGFFCRLFHRKSRSKRQELLANKNAGLT